MDIIGVKNPYGLVQQAGRKKRRTYRKKRTMRKKTRKNRK
jgi:hypothetical protein